MTLFSLSLILFLIIDPIGNIMPTLTLVEGTPNPRRIIIKEMLIALLIMVIFNYIGEILFEILGLSEITLNLSSGIILFLAALRILFPPALPFSYDLPKGTPFLVPLAIPMISGPALLATIMLFAHLIPSQIQMLSAIVIAWIAATIILLFAAPIKRVLGANGLIAAARLIGIVLAMISIQRIMDGINAFVMNHYAA